MSDDVDPVFFVTLHSAINDPANTEIKEELSNLLNRFKSLFDDLDKKLGKFIITNKPFGEPLDDLEVRFRADNEIQRDPVFQKLSVNISFIFISVCNLQADILGYVQSIFNKMQPGSKITAALPTVTKLWETIQLVHNEAWKLKSDKNIKKAIDDRMAHIKDFPFVQELIKLRVFL